MAFPPSVCDVRCLHLTCAPRLGDHPAPAPSPASLIQQVETLMWASTSRHSCSGLGLCGVTYTMSWVRASTKLFCCQAQLCAVLCSVGWKVCAVHALIINTYIKIDVRAPHVPQTFEHKSDCLQAMHLENAHPSEVSEKYPSKPSKAAVGLGWEAKWRQNLLSDCLALTLLWYNLSCTYIIFCTCKYLLHLGLFQFPAGFITGKYWQRLVAFSSFPKHSWQILIKKTTDYT